MPQIINPCPQRQARMARIKQFVKSTIPASQRTTAVEVGVFCGDSTLAWLDLFQQVVCIDAWDAGAYVDDRDIIARKGQAHLDDAEYTFDARMKNYGDRVKKLKMTSDEAAAMWFRLSDDITVPFVYIDAGHDGESVTKDIHNWGDRCDYILAGHDYNRKSWPGVVNAVNNAFGGPDVTFPDSSWLVNVARRRDPNRPENQWLHVYEFYRNVAVLAAANKSSFKDLEVRNNFDHRMECADKTWWVQVVETADNHVLFSGRGDSIEAAYYATWTDALAGFREYDMIMPATLNHGNRLP